MSLERRTPLRRTGKIRRVSIGRARAERHTVTVAVFSRDRYTCILAGHEVGPLGECFGHLTPHHLQKASQGGPHTLGNLVTLCSGHNGSVEDHPHAAHALGLVVRSGETTALAWQRLRDRGLV